MADAQSNALYSPYGAYEMKAKYQRNFFVATLIVTGFVGVLLLSAYIIFAEDDVEAIAAAPIKITTIKDIPPPPAISRPKVEIQTPVAAAAPKVGIPKAVADEEVMDEDVVLATQEELADIQAPDITEVGGEGGIEVDISDDEYLPPPDEFVPVEVYPEMIYQETPEYPRMARDVGLTGTVWVQALVDKDGNVRDARTQKSSGTQALDDAAVKAAFKNKFKPAIQNGRPVACWVSYSVVFKNPGE